MMNHKKFKAKLVEVSGYKTTYAQLTLSQTIKIQRYAKKLFGDMNMIEFHELIEKFPSLGKHDINDLPF